MACGPALPCVSTGEAAGSCNPGARTINAALDPADVSYLYFCHDSSAKYYYADTYEEHLENLKKAGIAS